MHGRDATRGGGVRGAMWRVEVGVAVGLGAVQAGACLQLRATAHGCTGTSVCVSHDI